jgi:hypothetical protein
MIARLLLSSGIDPRNASISRKERLEASSVAIDPGVEGSCQVRNVIFLGNNLNLGRAVAVCWEIRHFGESARRDCLRAMSNLGPIAQDLNQSFRFEITPFFKRSSRLLCEKNCSPLRVKRSAALSPGLKEGIKEKEATTLYTYKR